VQYPIIRYSVTWKPRLIQVSLWVSVLSPVESNWTHWLLQRGVSTFSRRRVTMTLAYRFAGRKVINEDNLLKLRGTYWNHYQVTFTIRFTYYSLRYLPPLLLELSFNIRFNTCYYDSHASLQVFISKTRPSSWFDVLHKAEQLLTAIVTAKHWLR
jgi:hypothetical protein